jgi:hypothetical protein
MSLCASILISCGSGGDGGGVGSEMIEIRGVYVGAAAQKQVSQDQTENLTSQSIGVLEIDQLAIILVFYPDGEYEHVTAKKDGSFKLDVKRGEPHGLIFVGVEDNFLGYLTLGDGLDSIPLTNVSDEIATIDLETLTSNGTIIEPAHNPLGNEIYFSEEELNFLRQFDDSFVTTVKNPDVDGNGKIDLLEDKPYDISFDFNLEGGSFRGSTSPILREPILFKHYQISTNLCEYHDDPTDVIVYFSGPEGSGLNSYPTNKGEIYCLAAIGPYYQAGAANIPPAGEYSVTDGETTLTISFPDQSNIQSNVVIPIPSVSVSDQGFLQKVSWEWKSGNGVAVNPIGIIKTYSLGIDAEGSSCGNFPQGNRVYEAYNLDLGADEHALNCDIVWDDVIVVRMRYENVYGKQIIVDFINEGPS